MDAHAGPESRPQCGDTSLLRTSAERTHLVFINCGPEPMVRRCFELQRAWAPPERIYGSIEYMTSCGVGICGKCASPSGALTCIDGPFLPLREFERA